MELNEIHKIALKGGASDIHLKPGLPAMFRVDGALVPLKNGERLSPEQVQKMAYGIMSPAQNALVHAPASAIGTPRDCVSMLYVQMPVVDSAYPAGPNRNLRLYIPSGLQHMNGTQALRYARSRNTSSDFDRGARQQRLLLSLREQADPQALVPRIPELVSALKKSIKTDIPLDQLDELLGLASEVDTKDIRSYVFSPPRYQREVLTGYWTIPYVDRIRDAVANAFKVDPKLEAKREAHAAEGAIVWVLNGTSDANRGFRLAGYLQNQGINASAPRGKPEGGVPAKTKIQVYNGAETEMATTLAYLESRFKVKAELVNDPTVRADIVVTIGRNTPDLRPPPSS